MQTEYRERQDMEQIHLLGSMHGMIWYSQAKARLINLNQKSISYLFYV